MPKPYQVAQICYDPTNLKYPWYTLRQGTVAEQGGYHAGTESTHHETIEGACDHLKALIGSDIETIKRLIDKKEKA